MKNHCLFCGNLLKRRPLLVMENMPASAQNIPDSKQIQKDEGITLKLCQCSECGLIQFDCEPVDYYKDVIRAGGYSTTMTELRRKQYRHLIETYHLEGKKFIEVGCGQGEFLNVLHEFPVESYGIEHNQELVEKARNLGLSVTHGFTETTETVFPNAPYDVFLSFNFLEHQPDPNTMLQCIWNNLAADGMGLITVPSFEYIMQNDGYYELIRDHIAYYSFETLCRLLECNGFEVLEKEVINRDTLSVVVRKRQALDTVNLIHGRDAIASEIEDWLSVLKGKGVQLATWGAGHQGFTLVSTTALKDNAKYIIDSAPFKQGRYAPASHLPIVSPSYFHQDPVQAILIIAPGYTEEIAENIRKEYGNEVQIRAIRSNHLETLQEGDQ